MARRQARPTKEQEIKDTSPLKVLEDSDTAFDPTTQYLDLSKEEKRRTTALMMAIQAYQNLIIKDADYLREAANLAQRDVGPKITPATMNEMVAAAVQFDFFIGSGGVVTTEEIRGGLSTTRPQQSIQPDDKKETE